MGFGERRKVTMPRPGKDLDPLAAATLYALRASHSAEVMTRVRRYKMSASTVDNLDANDAIRRLAELPKPVVCSSIVQDSSLIVDCQHVASNSLAPSETDLLLGEPMRLRSLYHAERPSIVLRASDPGIRESESHVLTYKQALKWRRDYLLADATLVLRSADGDAQKLGANIIAELSGPIDIELVSGDSI